MSSPRKLHEPLPLLTAVKREPREADIRPLDFSLIRRLFHFTAPYRRIRTSLLLLCASPASACGRVL